jgi:tripartite-type tricarboxylate transporter receptor subunit TctC
MNAATGPLRGRDVITRAIALLALTAAAVSAVAAAPPAAQNYPERPIRVLVPFAPGGATDIVTRMLGPKLSERLGQQIVPDNRAGAAGNIAVELVATAQPDGYTILVGNISTNSINPLLFARTMKVNALKDLTGVTLLASIPNVIIGGPKLPAANLKEAIAYARERPGQLNYSAPLGSYSHLDMLALTAAAGIRMVHIPSKGAGETLPLLMRGETHLTNSNVASNIGPIRAGQIKAYAVTATRRLAELPEVPTLTESGFPGIGSMNWNGMFVPARTPRVVIDKLYAATVAVMKEAEMQELFARRSVPLVLSESPAEFNAYVQSESRRWEKIIRDNNVRID